MEKLHNLVYKVSNNFDDMFYIGKHATNNLDDGYMGSGLRLMRAIKKYGKENFKKEILYDVENKELIDFIEEIIVDELFIARKDTYNMALGGTGGNLGEEVNKRNGLKSKGRKQPPRTIEQRNNYSFAQIGSHFYNNGIECRYTKKCPGKGWVLGMLPRSKEHCKNISIAKRAKYSKTK